MIRSMTGFGRCRTDVNGRIFTVEIKSVNSRYLECNTKISHTVGYLEEKIKPYLQSRGVARGKVDVFITVEQQQASDVGIELDETYLKSYLAALQQLKDGYGLRDDISVMTVAENSNIFITKKPEENQDRDWADLLSVLEPATDAFLASREREGESLRRDLLAKREEVSACVDKIQELSKDTVENYRQRLAERVRDALEDNRISVDESRILTECAIFADKVAIDEELVRLRTHLASLKEILLSDEPVGRRLDFLMQEINREINTTGSKCNDANVARLVVDVKCILEKIREQIQNLE